MELKEEDEAALRAMLQARKATVRRIDDSELGARTSAAEAAASKPSVVVKPSIGFAARPMAVVITKRKPVSGGGDGDAAKKMKLASPVAAGAAGSDSDQDRGGGLLGLGSYGSESNSEC